MNAGEDTTAQDETFLSSRCLSSHPPLPHLMDRHIGTLDFFSLTMGPSGFRTLSQTSWGLRMKRTGPGRRGHCRAQRGDTMDRLLSTFPVGDSLQGTHYHDGGEGEDGERRNDALTSIAGGLQAVGREKGGFGFRFGRKRWTDRGSGSDEAGVLNGKESGV
ncbi:hypothetical protein Q5P01_018804 [Channa striata]|uniref:Uncharacterized protein n=1 Tax=Channa striata TaxID=64152 RepID=A0AA88SEG7_CHASR|nr:hypothetical protein Q5P01_018804 [Channa striata]